MTFRLTAASIMRPQKGDHGIVGFGEGHLWGGIETQENWLCRNTQACTRTNTAQSTWRHCYIGMPSITPICIIGFYIVWPRHIKVRCFALTPHQHVPIVCSSRCSIMHCRLMLQHAFFCLLTSIILNVLNPAHCAFFLIASVFSTVRIVYALHADCLQSTQNL